MAQYKEFIKEHVEDCIDSLYPISSIIYESELKGIVEELQRFVDDIDDTLKENIINYVEDADSDFVFDALDTADQRKFIKMSKDVVSSYIDYLNKECDVEDDIAQDDYYGYYED